VCVAVISEVHQARKNSARRFLLRGTESAEDGFGTICDGARKPADVIVCGVRKQPRGLPLPQLGQCELQQRKRAWLGARIREESLHQPRLETRTAERRRLLYRLSDFVFV
jgi:hypothetical protein